MTMLHQGVKAVVTKLDGFDMDAVIDKTMKKVDEDLKKLMEE
jgi:low affinity Fe/Cu permease